ncbi:hypothetical protein ACN27G_27595 [Plantactinospora sp. WMMB334]|uniref:hypothetical protein n=1 Tax=Plantactinospora sp. WMMB334 TaxID=3404119 RepID=UPI003B93032E
MVEASAVEARLREIVGDPSWPGWFRAEVKSWGAEGLEPASLADGDIREALRARMLTRPKPGGPPMTREGIG